VGQLVSFLIIWHGIVSVSFSSLVLAFGLKYRIQRINALNWFHINCFIVVHLTREAW